MKVRTLMVYVAVVAFIIGPFPHYHPNDIFAPGYSERGFNRIRVGMSRLDVLRVAGRPLAGDDPYSRDYRGFCYGDPSEGGCSPSVTFDADGRVERIFKSQHSLGYDMVRCFMKSLLLPVAWVVFWFYRELRL